MKITLVNPSFYDGKEFRNRFEDYLQWIKGGNLYVAPFEPPLGLACLCAFLKAQGHETRLIDMQGLCMDSQELARRLAAHDPDLVGITAMTPTFPEALRVARIVRTVAPRAHTVLGGVHPTLDPDGALAEPDVDFVIRGEGEAALAALAQALQDGRSPEGIDGLCHRLDGALVISGKARRIDDLDSLPMPDYAAFPIDRYIEHNQSLRGIRGISMIVSRGCPYQCAFCAVHQTMGRKWRIKSPGRVVEEVAALKADYGIEGIWFKDSIFNLDRQWVREFCRLLLEKQLGIRWQALTRIDLIDEAELRLMRQAGLTQLDLGIETGSPKSLARLRKKITVQAIREKVRLAKRYVKVFGFFMIGIPGEDESDVRQTFDLAKSLELDRFTWSIYSPLPGSILYDELIAAGKIEPYRLDYQQVHFTKAYGGICDIAPERLEQLYQEINEYFYNRESRDNSLARAG